MYVHIYDIQMLIHADIHACIHIHTQALRFCSTSHTHIGLHVLYILTHVHVFCNMYTLYADTYILSVIYIYICIPIRMCLFL